MSVFDISSQIRLTLNNSFLSPFTVFLDPSTQMTQLSSIAFDSDQWKLIDSDKSSKMKAGNQTLTIESGPKTDWWRTAVGSEPESGVNRSSGPLYYIEVPSDSTHWKAGVWISGSFEERFQQATLFLGVGDYAGQGAWVKAGIEVEDDQHNVGCVVASPYSDWSISPLKDKIGSKDGESKLYLQYTRVQADVFVHFAVGSTVTRNPPSELQLLREIKGFGVQATEVAPNKRNSWHLGVMVCGPLSQQTTAQWDHFSVEYSK